MTKIQVNNSVSNSFVEFAEQLLNANSQDIHSLCTELYTAAQKFCTACPQVANKQAVNDMCALICGCLIAGWKGAITGNLVPPMAKTDFPQNKRAENLTAPFKTKGFYIACAQIESCIKRGHHVSQTLSRRANGTQDTPPSGAS